MAIRLGPVPAFARLRYYMLRFQERSAFRESASRTAAPQTRPGWRERLAQSTRRQECEALLRYLDQYEEMADLLCRTAHEGITEQRTLRYEELRRQVIPSYRAVRARMRSYLQKWEGPLDPFEQLCSSESIADIVNAPGSMEVMMRARYAAELCREAIETENEADRKGR